MSLRNVAKAVHVDFDFIYNECSVLNENAAAAIIFGSSTIDGLLDRSSICWQCYILYI